MIQVDIVWMCARESFTWLMCKCLQTSDRSVQRARLMVPALRQNLHNHQFTTLCPSTDPHPNPNWLAGDLQQHWYMEPCKARKIRAQKSHNCKTSPNFHDCWEKTSATCCFSAPVEITPGHPQVSWGHSLRRRVTWQNLTLDVAASWVANMPGKS